MKIFASYSHNNSARVDELIQLTQNAVKELDHHIHYDTTLLRTGDDWWTRILDEIEHSDAVMIFLSPSYANSEVCLEECKFAITNDMELFIYAIEPVVMQKLPDFLQQKHIEPIYGVDAATQALKIIGPIIGKGKRLENLPPKPQKKFQRPPTPIALSDETQTVENLLKQGLSEDAQNEIVIQLKKIALRDENPRRRAKSINLLVKLYNEGRNRVESHILLDIYAFLNVVEVQTGIYEVIRRWQSGESPIEGLLSSLENIGANRNAEAFIYSLLVYEQIRKMRDTNDVKERENLYKELMTIIEKLQPGISA